MFRRIALFTALGMLLAVSLVACARQLASTTVADADVVSASATPTPLPDGGLPARGAMFDMVYQEPTATPAPPSAPQKQTVRVWWPDELYPSHSPQAEEILTNQFESFRLTYTTYELDVRRKRTNGLGGILPTLRTASPVAPNALPDLTLLRRSDMVTAATEGLIVPLDGWVPADLAGGNLFPDARALGEIDGVLYGVPYALNIYHTIYRTALFEDPPLTFADVLAHDSPYLFAAGNPPVSWAALLQYRAAGGRLVDEVGSAVLDADPLLAVLDYYAQGTEQGIFSPDLLAYTTYEDYWSQFVSGEAGIAGVDAITYLSVKDSIPDVGLAAIPTVDGLPVSALDGWLWVLTTQDPDHQQRARAFLSWMMRVSQQALYTEAFGILPSQPRALRLWDNTQYANFAQTLIAAAEIIPDTQRSNAAALALQESLAAVLDGAPPEIAADVALGKLGGS